MPDAPLISPPEGTYPLPILAELFSSVPGATIRYTRDGTPPGSASTQYLAPISISATTTVQAVVVDATGTTSDVSQAAYFIGQQPGKWSRDRLAKSILIFVGAYFAAFIIYAIYSAYHHTTMFGSSGSEFAMTLSGIFCVTGCLLLALLAFYLGELRFILYCLLSEILGCGVGWLLGTYFSPSGSAESQQFQQIGVTVGTLLSGVLLSKLLRVVDTFLDPARKSDYASALILGSYFAAAAIFVSVTVYVDRAYGPAFSISADYGARDSSSTIFAKEIVTADNGICVVLSEPSEFPKEEEGKAAVPTDFHPLIQFLRSTNISRPAAVHWSLSPENPGIVINPGTGQLTTKAIKSLPAESPAAAGKKPSEATASTLYFGNVLAVNQRNRGAYGMTNFWIGSDLFSSTSKLTHQQTCKDRIDQSTEQYSSSDSARVGSVSK